MAESPGPDIPTPIVNEKTQHTSNDTSNSKNDNSNDNSQDISNDVSNQKSSDPDPEKNDTSSTDSANGLDRWNTPRINTYRFCVVNFSLFIMGFNDASLGALIPYV